MPDLPPRGRGDGVRILALKNSSCILGIGVALAFMGCGTATSSDPASMQGSWAGTIEGTDGYIAFVASQDRIVAYACDSAAIHDWFTVAATSNVAASANGLSLSAAPSADAWRGQLTLADGSSHAFVADRSAAPILFRAEGETPDARWLGGWIDRGGAGQRGTLIVDRSGSTTQLSPTLTTTTLTLSSTGGLGGLTVKAIDDGRITRQRA